MFPSFMRPQPVFRLFDNNFFKHPCLGFSNFEFPGLLRIFTYKLKLHIIITPADFLNIRKYHSLVKFLCYRLTANQYGWFLVQKSCPVMYAAPYGSLICQKQGDGQNLIPCCSQHFPVSSFHLDEPDSEFIPDPVKQFIKILVTKGMIYGKYLLIKIKRQTAKPVPIAIMSHYQDDAFVLVQQLPEQFRIPVPVSFPEFLLRH